MVKSETTDLGKPDQPVSMDIKTEGEEDAAEFVHMWVKLEAIKALIALEEGLTPDQVPEESEAGVPYKLDWAAKFGLEGD